MALFARIAPVTSSRPCRFCISLQDDSAFADFEVDEEGRASLVRISFDGYGCSGDDFKKMAPEDSRALLAAMKHGSLEDSKIEMMLRPYFQENPDVIWKDALTTHELL